MDGVGLRIVWICGVGLRIAIPSAASPVTAVCMISMIAIALYSVVCSQCSTCGLPQQEDSLPELIVQIHTVGYRMLVHSQDFKRLQFNRLPQQVR